MDQSIRYKKLVFLLFYLVACVLIKVTQAEEIKLAVASNFLKPMQSIVTVYERESGNRVSISSGSTGKLYTQIIQGAPYDLFFAANMSEPMRLERDGFAVPGSRITYAVGKIVLWSKNINITRTADIKQALTDKTIKTLAIANPKTAPYGAAAMDVIQKLNISLNDMRVVRGENINQTWQFLQTGSADIGFIAASQLGSLHDQGHYLVVPLNLYTPIEQQAVVLASGKHIAVAMAFMKLLQRSDINQQIANHGYDLINTSNTFVMQEPKAGG